MPLARSIKTRRVPGRSYQKSMVWYQDRSMEINSILGAALKPGLPRGPGFPSLAFCQLRGEVQRQWPVFHSSLRSNGQGRLSHGTASCPSRQSSSKNVSNQGAGGWPVRPEEEGSGSPDQALNARDDAVFEPRRERDRPPVDQDRARSHRAAQLAAPSGLVSPLREHPVGRDIAGHLVRVAGHPYALRSQLTIETQRVTHADLAGERH